MTDEQKAHLSVQMRLAGVHPSWIEYWWRCHSYSMENIYRSGVDEWVERSKECLTNDGIFTKPFSSD